jgi:TatD DNase family protein
MDYRFIDTHCHIHFQAYKEDMDAIVKRSLEAGVGMITVGTQSTTSKNGIDLAERYDGVWCTIGLHPNHLHAQDFFDDNELPPPVTEGKGEAVLSKHDGPAHIHTRAERFDWDYYRELAKHPKVVAIGELGLDYYRVPPGVDLESLKQDQKDQAREQIRFATEVDKPVVIHCRDAHADQAELLREEIDRGGLARRGVIHCFTGTAEEAAVYAELGFYVSFTGIVTFGKNVMAAAKVIPLSQIMIETDSPYLTPAPHRGRRNEPVNVEHVAAKIAELKDISVEEVAKVTTENAVRLFGLES